MAENQQFYIGQKAVIEKDGKVLILHVPIYGRDLPGGRIQVGETDFIESLKREVFEETGLNISVGRPFHAAFFQMPLSAKGKHQKDAGKLSYIVYFTAHYISGEIVLSDEHDSYIWANKNNYMELIKDNLGNNEKALEIYFAMKDT